MATLSHFPVLQQFILAGGTIDIGRIDIIECAAVASDQQKFWVTLTRRQGETLVDLLERLDSTLGHCLETNQEVDEIEYLVQ